MSAHGVYIWFESTTLLLVSPFCRSLKLETYSRFSHEQLFVEDSRESFVQSVIKVGYKVEW